MIYIDLKKKHTFCGELVPSKRWTGRGKEKPLLCIEVGVGRCCLDETSSYYQSATLWNRQQLWHIVAAVTVVILGAKKKGDLIQGLSPLAASRPQSHVRLSVQAGGVDVVMMQPYKFQVEQLERREGTPAIYQMNTYIHICTYLDTFFFWHLLFKLLFC